MDTIVRIYIGFGVSSLERSLLYFLNEIEYDYSQRWKWKIKFGADRKMFGYFFLQMKVLSVYSMGHSRYRHQSYYLHKFRASCVIHSTHIDWMKFSTFFRCCIDGEYLWGFKVYSITNVVSLSEFHLKKTVGIKWRDNWSFWSGHRTKTLCIWYICTGRQYF